MSNLDELEALAVKATEGPWMQTYSWEYVIPATHKGRPIGGSSDPIINLNYAEPIVRCPTESMHQRTPVRQLRANAAYIAALDPQTVLSLIATIRAQAECIKAADAIRLSMKHAGHYVCAMDDYDVARKALP